MLFRSVEVFFCDNYNMPEIIKGIKNIIEVEKGNEIYLNMSSGTHIQGAGILYASAILRDHGNLHTYCIDDKISNTTSSHNVRTIQPLPIPTPDERLRKALVAIYEHTKNKIGKISKSECGELLTRLGIINPNPSSGNELQVTMNYMNQNIIIPLEKRWGLIKTVKEGRKWFIFLTDDGKNSAIYYADSKQDVHGDRA